MVFHLRLSGGFFPIPPFYYRTHLEEVKAPGSQALFLNPLDRGGLMPAALLRVPLVVALPAERDAVA